MKNLKKSQFWLVSRVDGELQRYRLNMSRMSYGVALGISTLLLISFLAGVDYAKGYHWVHKQISGEAQLEAARAERLRLLKKARALNSKEQELKKFNQELVERLNELNGLLKKATDYGVVKSSEFKRISLKQDELAEFANQDRLDKQLLEILADYSETIKFIPLGSPVDSGRISSGYGYRNSPTNGTRKLHTGIDFATSYGAPVKATAYGTVIQAKKISGYGLTVDLEHGPGVVTRYAHLAALSVSVGDRLHRGEVIGMVGMTGRSTGPHVHYELIISGKPKSPHTLVELFNKFKPDVLIASLPLA
jgi:murein DD-endopeptidase MepM/ murein hydrolase activator NlpD